MIYLVCSIVAGSAYISTITEQNMVIFSILTGLQFAVGVAIVYSGVRLIWVTGACVPGISQKLIPNSIPAVDCAVFFTFSPTAVVIGFISSFIGGLVGMLMLGGLGMALIIRAWCRTSSAAVHPVYLRTNWAAKGLYYRLLYRRYFPRLLTGHAVTGAGQPGLRKQYLCRL